MKYISALIITLSLTGCTWPSDKPINKARQRIVYEPYGGVYMYNGPTIFSNLTCINGKEIPLAQWVYYIGPKLIQELENK